MHIRNHLNPCLAWLILAALMTACSQSTPTPEQQATAAASASEVQANKELALYRTLREQESWELAAPIGQEIVTRFPDTAAAREVTATLSETKSKGGELTARRRLERLWIYQSGKESGGDQNSASIYSSDRSPADRVRLVLRHHSDWGQSVYLFGAGKGFECRGNCTLAVRFDDKAQGIKAYLPKTGEAAMFIRDDKAFLERMQKALTVAIDVTEKGKDPRTLVFEVGGFDPAKWSPLVKQK